jgi:hypothetical protein
LESPAPNPSGVWLRNHGLKLIFVFTYALLLVMIFEQGHVISEQQKLIRDLYTDSAKLASLKAKQLMQNRH